MSAGAEAVFGQDRLFYCDKCSTLFISESDAREHETLTGHVTVQPTAVQGWIAGQCTRTSYNKSCRSSTSHIQTPTQKAPAAIHVEIPGANLDMPEADPPSFPLCGSICAAGPA
ncbi:MAG TPA: hypothetical protein VJZ68_09050 [Nitrososphaera sp.]|nr:hypothetical protein [Nitrososphaera sp.]